MVDSSSMPTVEIPPPYRGPTKGERYVEVEGTTIGECLRAVDSVHPGFGRLVFDASGDVHRFVKLFLNEAPVPRDALDTPVSEQDEVSILAAIAGG